MSTTGSRALALGALAWIVGVLQYGICQIAVAQAWPTPYSLHDNFISDLGNTACGPWTPPHGTPIFVCSPAHVVMNASFVVAGLLTLVGAVLLRRFWPAGPLATTAMWLWVAAGLGKIVVGLVPENTDAALHLLGAFVIPLGSIAILLLSIAVRRSAPLLAAVGFLIVVLGLVGTVLSTAGQVSPTLLLGLGLGGAERLAGYPGNVWMLLVGLLSLTRGHAVTPADAAPASRVRLFG